MLNRVINLSGRNRNDNQASFRQSGHQDLSLIHIFSEEGKISLSMKKAMDPPPSAPRGGRRPFVSPGRPGNFEWQSNRNEPASFEDMMSKFKQSSEEKMSDLKRNVDSKRGGFSRRGGSR